MMAHLDVCREIYYKTMAAEGRPIDEIICNNWIHFVPKFEEKLHNLLCKETPKDDSDDQQGKLILFLFVRKKVVLI